MATDQNRHPNALIRVRNYIYALGEIDPHNFEQVEDLRALIADARSYREDVDFLITLCRSGGYEGTASQGETEAGPHAADVSPSPQEKFYGQA